MPPKQTKNWFIILIKQESCLQPVRLSDHICPCWTLLLWRQNIFISTFIHFHFCNHLSCWWSRGGWSLSQLTLGERQGIPWTGHQAITGLTRRDRQPFTLTFSRMDNLESPINLHVFGLWEEAGVPRKNPRWHRENMQTLHRRAPPPRVQTRNHLAVRKQC